ncbi:MAG TPA: OmpA family protein [Allosphingosinicella sp.]|jgi:outer membrane protein OmpA-like peptidoglycan-associated protein/opacity protein-like surface antigen
MRKLAFGLASAAAIVASPAQARDGAMYIGGEFGAMRVGDIDIDIGAVENAVTVEHEYGYDGGVFIGYDFGAFRLEAEGSYRNADLDAYTTTIRLPLEGAVFAPGREASGNTSVLSFMVNGLLDFGDDDGISATIGGGAGMARVNANLYRNFANATPFVDGSDWTMAWQLLAGVRQAISDNVDVTVRYRFFNTRSVELTAFNGGATDMRFRSHSIMGGLTFNLGGAEPAPPPLPPVVTPPPYVAPPAPTPPPPPPIQCPGGTMVQPGETCPSIGPFIVFFDWDRDEITPQAAGILDNAAEQYRATGNAQVVLAGHADRSGSDQYNVGLSQRRAENVRQYLAGRGVAEGVMRTEAFGESRPAVETADGVREPQNRRVEITFGPGSGW